MLKIYPDLENNNGTVTFIIIFVELWKIANAHSPYGHICMQDLNRVIIRTPNDENLLKLIDMSNFAKEIANKSGKCAKYLTKDTENCLSQTCNKLVDLSTHLLGKTNEYVTLGIYF